MLFEFTADDQAFREKARNWLQASVPSSMPPHSGWPARDYALGWLAKLHAGGWSGISWPTEFGGMGLSTERQMIWHEEYVRAGAPSVLNPTFVSLNHAGPTLMACGTTEQKRFHLPKILSGEVLWCQGFSEPESGSDLASLRTTGTLEGDHLVINGHKIWTSFADIADYQELLIRTQPGSRRHSGLSWVICDMKAEGITVRPIENMAGAVHFAEVFYDNVRIPLTQVVGQLHHGWEVAMTTLGFERKTAAAALQLALARKVEKLIAMVSTDQRPFATPAGLRHDLAMARAQAAGLRALTYRTAFKDPSTPFDGSLVRLYFAEFSQRVHALAMQVLGPAAVEIEATDPWAYDYLESFSETIAGGTSEIQRNIIGERILGLPRTASH